MRFFYLFSLCLALAAAPAAVAQNAGGRGQGANWVAASDAPARDGVEFIRRMRDESGILAMWSAGQCGFLHLTFQEYLAGFG